MIGRNRSSAVPVLMLHSVAPRSALAPYGWLQDISVEPDLVEESFRDWRRRGWKTHSLGELEASLSGRSGSLPPGLVLTLDDGYLDNWVALSPLLGRYGFRATVFISTDFIAPRAGLRPRLHDVPPTDAISWTGYLSWDEMRSLEREGTIDIQSHSKTHTWYFVSDKIIDYYRPENAVTRSGSMLRFLWLNSHSERKPFTLDEMRDDSVAWGTPIYEYRPALVARRFRPDPVETRIATDLVLAEGGAEFFRNPDWKARIDERIRRHREGASYVGHLESELEYVARVRNELSESQRILSEGLGKEILYLAFPQGAFNPVVESLARECGYRLWTMASWRTRQLNRSSSRSNRVYRCGSGYDLFGSGVSPRTRVFGQRMVIRRYSGALFARAMTSAVSAFRRVLFRPAS